MLYINILRKKTIFMEKEIRDQTIMLKSWNVGSKWSAIEFYNDKFKYIYFKVLVGINVDIIHIQHLIRHTRDFPKVANNLGLPMILSFHDFYYVCPSINLIGPDNGYCYGKCSTKNIQCKYPLQIFGTMPILTEFIKTWRQESSLLIDMCITFTAPTKSTIDLYISIYPQLKHMNYKLIEHGRDFNETHVKFDLPSENKPIKIVVPGIIKHTIKARI